MRSLNSDLLENNRDVVTVLVGESGIDALSRLRGCLSDLKIVSAKSKSQNPVVVEPLSATTTEAPFVLKTVSPPVIRKPGVCRQQTVKDPSPNKKVR